MTGMHLKPFSFQARTYKGNPSWDQRTKPVLEIPETNWSLIEWLNIKYICTLNSVQWHHEAECSETEERIIRSTKLVASWEIQCRFLNRHRYMRWKGMNVHFYEAHHFLVTKRVKRICSEDCELLNISQAIDYVWR